MLCVEVPHFRCILCSYWLMHCHLIRVGARSAMIAEAVEWYFNSEGARTLADEITSQSPLSIIRKYSSTFLYVKLPAS
jgi:hypothetical protein